MYIPNQNHILLAHIRVHVGHYWLALRGRAGSARHFRYQHVGIGNAGGLNQREAPIGVVSHCSGI